jgi:hypothetical protein
MAVDREKQRRDCVKAQSDPYSSAIYSVKTRCLKCAREETYTGRGLLCPAGRGFDLPCVCHTATTKHVAVTGSIRQVA